MWLLLAWWDFPCKENESQSTFFPLECILLVIGRFKNIAEVLSCYSNVSMWFTMHIASVLRVHFIPPLLRVSLPTSFFAL